MCWLAEQPAAERECIAGGLNSWRQTAEGLHCWRAEQLAAVRTACRSAHLQARFRVVGQMLSRAAASFRP